ncbi:MAG: folate family ECF transporter S component [Armatimonadetes bacterium]|nr:folate family ECF transporter S component [Armatimonadota bacterium]
MSHRRTLFITQVALMVALAVVVRRLATPQVPMLNLGGLPIILAGLILGPLAGACTGAISDVLGYFFVAVGPYHPAFTLTAALTGALPPLILRGLPGRAASVADESVARLAVAIFIGQTITKVGMKPFIMHELFGWSIWLTAKVNLVVQLVHAPLYAVVARPLLRAVTHSRRVPAVPGQDPMPYVEQRSA